ncbi:MAG: serine/threonine protein kinase, partial [Myxococcales bacterium]|nr:serine/threonine protein kinase [Myxococcales bacterium]
MNAQASTAGEPSSDRNLAGRQLGRYEVLTQLASGGMAAVYVGRAQGVAGFERLVAIKVLHPHLAYEQEFISMFLDEARLAARIRHNNVVATLDISDSEGDGYFLVMDYIEGDHLGALLGRAAKQGRRLSPPVVARILIDALMGLAAAHALTDELGNPLHLVHRDISPHNIMVGTDGIARLTDFGVAKAEVRMASTRAGQFKGKLSYMAPEQASTGNADQRSDLFSMGIILWESLTGRRLFRADNNAATLTKILNEPVQMPSELLPELAPFDPVVRRALERDPEARFQTADEFMEALEEAVGTVGGAANSRRVADAVKALVGDKLTKDRARVRAAIEHLGRAEIGEAMMPMPREGSASAVSRQPSGPQRASVASTSQFLEPALDSSPGATGNTTIVVQEEGGGGLLGWLVAALLILVVAAGVLFLYRQTQPYAGPASEPAPLPERAGAAPHAVAPATSA